MSDDGPIVPLWRRAGFLVRRLHQISVAIFLREMEGLDLTPVQLGALTVVLERPGIDQSALGAELGIDLDQAAVLTRWSRNLYAFAILSTYNSR